MTVAARTRLDGPSLDPLSDDQRSQALVIALAAVDAREPGPLPVGTAAPAPETPGSLEPAQLREHRPCPADRAIAATPPGWDMGLQLAAARLQQRPHSEVHDGLEGRRLDLRLSRCPLEHRAILPHGGGGEPDHLELRHTSQVGELAQPLQQTPQAPRVAPHSASMQQGSDVRGRARTSLPCCMDAL